MKKLAFIFTLSLFFSCSKSDDETFNKKSINPNLLTKVIFDPNTSYEKHWDFNSDGLLQRISKPDGTIIQDFVYDSNSLLISTTKYDVIPNVNFSFGYDTNGYVNSVNGVTYTYDSATSSYTTDYNHQTWTDGTPEGTGSNTYYNKTIINSDKLVIQRDFYQTEVIGPDTFNDVRPFYRGLFQNSNLIHSSSLDGSGSGYEFDNKVNPLKKATYPICKAFSVIGYIDNLSWADTEFNSINNLIKKLYTPLDPEKQIYVYDFNSNNLPTQQMIKHYYLGNFEGSTISKKYYYQGDIIP